MVLPEVSSKERDRMSIFLSLRPELKDNPHCATHLNVIYRASCVNVTGQMFVRERAYGCMTFLISPYTDWGPD